MSGWRQLVLGAALATAMNGVASARGGEEPAGSGTALANGSIAISVPPEPAAPGLPEPPAPAVASQAEAPSMPAQPDRAHAAGERAPSSVSESKEQIGGAVDAVGTVEALAKPQAAGARSVEESLLEARPLGKANDVVVRKTGTGESGKQTSTAGGLSSQIAEFGKVGGALAAVLALAFAARAIFRRAGGFGGGAGARPSGVVEILARYPVPGAPGGRGQQILVIKFARRIVLAHANGTSMTSLCEMTDADEVAGVLSRLEAGANTRTSGKFKQTLAEFQNEHRTVKVRESERLIPSQGDKAELVDLTRGNGRGLFGLLGRGGGGATA